MARRSAAALVAGTTAAALLFVGNASAAIVPTVPLGTSANYAVLGGSTVTSTGFTVLDGSLGLWPGTSITGFPPGIVLPPGTIDATNPAAQQAQSDLTVGYDNAAGRPLDGSTPADLANQHLAPGVYAGPSKSALLLTGPLVLDGAGDPTAVFIIQTDSTLITSSASTVTLVNGAQECNVFWLVGSSATLGTGSVFRGNILALTSITVNTSVVVHGRAMARNGAVTLDNATFVKPTCATSPPAPTTTAAPTTTTAALGATTSTTAAPRATTSTTMAAAVTTSTTAVAAAAGATTTSQLAATPTTAAPITALSITSATLPAGSALLTSATPAHGVPSEITTTATSSTTPALPRTGAPISTTLALAVMALTLGVLATRFGRPRAKV
ncbi:MAG TPA: ice-binding family protein [Acidimicrobiales bacterium]|nr:ice-binding family protein [Acidimicrobiales bacterium]